MTYERDAIVEWLSSHDTDPSTDGRGARRGAEAARAERGAAQADCCVGRGRMKISPGQSGKRALGGAQIRCQWVTRGEAQHCSDISGATIALSID